MTTNEIIRMIRRKSGISQAELAYKTKFLLEEIIYFETNGTRISGYILFKLLKALDVTIDEFSMLK